MPRGFSWAAYHAYLDSPEWARKRLAALKWAKHRCQVCNAMGLLDAHHRTYERFGKERPEDLTILCRDCHVLFHGDKKERQQRKKVSKSRRKTRAKERSIEKSKRKKVPQKTKLQCRLDERMQVINDDSARDFKR